MEDLEYHLKIAPGDHLKTWKQFLQKAARAAPVCFEASFRITHARTWIVWNRKDARHRPVERDTKTQYGLPRLMTPIIDGTQVRGPLSSSLGWVDLTGPKLTSIRMILHTIRASMR